MTISSQDHHQGPCCSPEYVQKRTQPSPIYLIVYISFYFPFGYIWILFSLKIQLASLCFSFSKICSFSLFPFVSCSISLPHCVEICICVGTKTRAQFFLLFSLVVYSFSKDGLPIFLSILFSNFLLFFY